MESEGERERRRQEDSSESLISPLRDRVGSYWSGTRHKPLGRGDRLTCEGQRQWLCVSGLTHGDKLFPALIVPQFLGSIPYLQSHSQVELNEDVVE